jgi:hypothetical protein
MKVVKINNVTIPQADIISLSNVSESLDHVGDSIAGSQATIVLDNVDGAYDERVAGSLFYATDWYNSEVEIYDTDVKLTIFVGHIKKYQIDDNSRRVTLTVNDVIVDMNDIVCVCAASLKTPAEVIYTILTDPNGLNLSTDRIVKGSFDAAIAYQNGLGIKVEVNYLAKDNIKVFDAIRTICQYTGASLYVRDNRIVYHQRKPYSGELGRNLYDSDIIVGSIKQESGELPIYNAYEITYKSGSGVATVSGVNYLSKVKYGVQNTFVVPQSGRNSTNASDYKVLFSTQAAAQAAGELILSLYAYRRTKIEFAVDLEYADIMLGDIVMAQFKPYVNEPIIVTEINKAPERRTMTVRGELVNYCHSVELDTTPPVKPEILGYLYNYKQQRLYIEATHDSTAVGYYAHVSYDGTFKDVVTIIDKLSPFKVRLYRYNNKQYLYFAALPGDYYIKIAAVDQARNISELSDVMYISIPGDVTSPSRRHYRCAGGVFKEYLTIDIYNQSENTPPENLVSYDDCPQYGVDRYEYAAIYDSDTIYNQLDIILEQSPDTRVGYRTYITNWTPWTADEATPITLPKLLLQLRLYITPRTWSEGLQYNYRIL